VYPAEDFGLSTLSLLLLRDEETISWLKKWKTAKKQVQWAWYLYDFGNSAYAAVVLLAVYATYFKDVVVGGPEGSALWGWH
jgi:MFS-type transporter involved in bile tolerance (Atg22 family)